MGELSFEKIGLKENIENIRSKERETKKIDLGKKFEQEPAELVSVRRSLAEKKDNLAKLEELEKKHGFDLSKTKQELQKEMEALQSGIEKKNSEFEEAKELGESKITEQKIEDGTGKEPDKEQLLKKESSDEKIDEWYEKMKENTETALEKLKASKFFESARNLGEALKERKNKNLSPLVGSRHVNILISSLNYLDDLFLDKNQIATVDDVNQLLKNIYQSIEAIGKASSGKQQQQENVENLMKVGNFMDDLKKSSLESAKNLQDNKDFSQLAATLDQLGAKLEEKQDLVSARLRAQGGM